MIRFQSSRRGAPDGMCIHGNHVMQDYPCEACDLAEQLEARVRRLEAQIRGLATRVRDCEPVEGGREP